MFIGRLLMHSSWVPQHRKRTIIVGFREKPSSHGTIYQYPKSINTQVFYIQDGSQKAEPPYTVGERGLVHSKYVLTDHLWMYLQEYAAKHKAKGNGFDMAL